MKLYEQAEAGRKLMPLVPVCARLDGKGFSKFTRGLKRLFDTGMVDAMILTTAYLVEETNARIGYTQSDEISLIYYSDTFDSEIFFNGKIQKMVSTLSAMGTAKFNSVLPSCLPSKVGLLPTFDCRVWTVPEPHRSRQYDSLEREGRHKEQHLNGCSTLLQPQRT